MSWQLSLSSSFYLLCSAKGVFSPVPPYRGYLKPSHFKRFSSSLQARLTLNTVYLDQLLGACRVGIFTGSWVPLEVHRYLITISTSENADAVCSWIINFNNFYTKLITNSHSDRLYQYLAVIITLVLFISNFSHKKQHVQAQEVHVFHVQEETRLLDGGFVYSLKFRSELTKIQFLGKLYLKSGFEYRTKMAFKGRFRIQAIAWKRDQNFGHFKCHISQVIDFIRIYLERW